MQRCLAFVVRHVNVKRTVVIPRVLKKWLALLDLVRPRRGSGAGREEPYEFMVSLVCHPVHCSVTIFVSCLRVSPVAEQKVRDHYLAVLRGHE
jgi:hypothetical protein